MAKICICGNSIPIGWIKYCSGSCLKKSQKDRLVKMAFIRTLKRMKIDGWDMFRWIYKDEER